MKIPSVLVVECIQKVALCFICACLIYPPLVQFSLFANVLDPYFVLENTRVVE